MKKWIAILALLSLAIWGVFDIMNNDSKIEDTTVVVGLEPGNTAPDFKLPTLEGEQIKLSDFRGKKVIMNMWASWCPPCKAEMPDLQSFYIDHQAEGIEVFGINLTEAEKNKQDVTHFIEEYELTFPIVLDEKSQTADLYEVTTIPTTYIVDSKGKIAQKIVGMVTYERVKEIISKVD